MKQNKKGFTLVELIVVMAIIAVLAAILVPTMLGFMNNAKYTQANANAKTVYTAVNSVVADYCTDNPALQGNQSAQLQSSALSTFKLKKAGGTTDETFDMSKYLEGMTGNSCVVLNASGTGCAYVVWSLNPGTIDSAQVSKSAQKDGTALSANNPAGCYPLA